MLSPAPFATGITPSRRAATFPAFIQAFGLIVGQDFGTSFSKCSHVWSGESVLRNTRHPFCFSSLTKSGNRKNGFLSPFWSDSISPTVLTSGVEDEG